MKNLKLEIELPNELAIGVVVVQPRFRCICALQCAHSLLPF